MIGDRCALFLRAPSPRRVARLLEKHFGKTESERSALDAFGFLLSHAAGPDRIRILFAPLNARTWLEERLPLFQTKLRSPVTLLYVDEAAGTWGYRVCSEGEVESADGAVAPASMLRRLLWPAPSGPSAAAIAWAQDRGLPTGLLAAPRDPRRIDFSTVSELDLRGLLVENTPRLYTLSFGGDR